MIRYPINALGQHGIIQDVKPPELPLNAWTNGRNVRFRDGYVEKFLGHAEVFGTPSVAPYYILPVIRDASFYWLYAGLTKVFAWDGSTHTNITQQPGGVETDYAATADRNWTSCVLGGIPILNNGIDFPQMWNPVALGQPLQMLSNWPGNSRCSALRAFKQFLVALDVTKSGVRFPYMVKWSHPAAPDNVPASWDETDPTKDAGEWELKETNGFVLDCLSLRDVNVVYKEDSVWGMQFIGGNFIFRFFNMFPDFGMLSRRCAAILPNGLHVVLTPNDIRVHNGQTSNSIVDGRTRVNFFKSINPDVIQRCFVALVKRRNEVWFCYPEFGMSFPNMALVWNYVGNTFGFRELPGVTHIDAGIHLSADHSDAWDNAAGDWNSDVTAWGDATFSNAFYRDMMASPQNSRIYLADHEANFAGASMTSWVERVGLGLPLSEEDPPDFDTRKFWTRLWPRLEGTLGGQVKVYVGAQEYIGGPVVYNEPCVYTIGSSDAVDCMVNSRLHALKFESTADIEWRLSGMEVEIRKAGRIT